ncbi:hypothetical protein D3C73_1518210 [compost metagenome]
MCARGTEKHAVGNDDSSPPTRLEQPNEECQEEKFRLLRFHDLQKVLRYIVVIQAAGERRICQNDVVLFLLLSVQVRK